MIYPMVPFTRTDLNLDFMVTGN